ncbi:hypothetical protein P154DRAFT_524345 [Amniculicola lignicola CBS 123094]|uniref:Coenzyme Q-binding protein COQ10 START domain-containing protein n=1 Tax=Amniculicola lignicola CBS 123094 TaxID=1392246 RepID=A0A6A5WA72_9PLEO|nr:hypothetical protein P154DRAFT_524345 [Amniculicola lignicola CBS 123094]
MATTKLLRPRIHTYVQPKTLTPHHQRRNFFDTLSSLANPLSTSAPQTLTASRTLPYPHLPIYTIIADISSYSAFVPYCQSSLVTAWSSPDKVYNKRWPSEAEVTVGWGSLTEKYISQQFCVPGRVVESIGGSVTTSLSKDEITHHLEGRSDSERKRSNGGESLLSHLRSKWTVESLDASKTHVRLDLEFAFANPLYATLSAGVAPKVADLMVQAFEGRVDALLKHRPELTGNKLG